MENRKKYGTQMWATKTCKAWCSSVVVAQKQTTVDKTQICKALALEWSELQEEIAFWERIDWDLRQMDRNDWRSMSHNEINESYFYKIISMLFGNVQEVSNASHIRATYQSNRTLLQCYRRVVPTVLASQRRRCCLPLRITHWCCGHDHDYRRRRYLRDYL